MSPDHCSSDSACCRRDDRLFISRERQQRLAGLARLEPTETASRFISNVPVGVGRHVQQDRQQVSRCGFRQSLRRRTSKLQVGIAKALHQKLGEPRRIQPEQRPEDLCLLVWSAIRIQVPEPGRRLGCLTMAERADDVKAQRIRGTQQHHQRRHRGLAASPDQQVEGFPLDLGLAVGQGAEKDDVGPGPRDLRRGPKRGYADDTESGPR